MLLGLHEDLFEYMDVFDIEFDGSRFRRPESGAWIAVILMTYNFLNN